MPKPLSFDLRSRVLAAVDGGLSCRQAAERFGVSPSSAIRWSALRRAGGDGRPKLVGGDRLSHKTEAHADLIHAALAEVPDITLPELKARLAQQGAQVSVSALWRFCRRHKITRKKDGACRRAGPPRSSQAARGVVRGPTGSRSRAVDLHRRDLGFHQHGPALWAGAPGATPAGRRAPRTLEDNHVRRRAAPERPCGALRARRADQPERV